jgi:hypothetical protein
MEAMMHQNGDCLGSPPNPLFATITSCRFDGAIFGGQAGYNWLAGIWLAASRASTCASAPG